MFDRSGAVPAGLDTGSEPWLSSDRDYTYAEVCLSDPPITVHVFTSMDNSYSNGFTVPFTHKIRLCSQPPVNDTLSHLRPSTGMATRRVSLPMYPTSANECVAHLSMLSHTCSPKWAQLGPWTALGDWSSRVASNKNRLRTCYAGILVSLLSTHLPFENQANSI